MKDNVLIKSYLISTADHLTHSNSSFPWVIRCKVRICKIDTLSFTKKNWSVSAMLCFLTQCIIPFAMRLCNSLPEWVDYPLIFALTVGPCFGM